MKKRTIIEIILAAALFLFCGWLTRSEHVEDIISAMPESAYTYIRQHHPLYDEQEIASEYMNHKQRYDILYLY